MPHTIDHAAELIAQADSLFITAGAGMGVDSGLPDFRGNEGFWRAYPRFKALGLSFTDLANPQWFFDDPAQAWGFYGHRYFMYQQTAPHAGFGILKRWLEQKNGNGFVFTSNVDGHFQKSGFADASVIECHGSINHLQCVENCSEAIWPAQVFEFSVDSQLQAVGQLPRCPHCGAIARPNILMFGDFAWNVERSEQQQRRYQQWRRHQQREQNKLVVIEMGAGLAIPTVRYESESVRAPIIRINPRDSEGGFQTLSLAMGALTALQQIDKCLSAG
jgi:NAD-dependent SIR2 family protein deacetylase